MTSYMIKHSKLMPKSQKKIKKFRQGYQIWLFQKMASVKTNKNKNLTPLLKSNFS